MVRSGRYLPMFREIFAEEGLPLDLIYMAQVESAFKTNAYSRARALGIWERWRFRTRYVDEYLVTFDQADARERTAAAIARLDVLCAFTERAVALDFCCPEISDETGIDIRGGRHPGALAYQQIVIVALCAGPFASWTDPRARIPSRIESRPSDAPTVSSCR